MTTSLETPINISDPVTSLLDVKNMTRKVELATDEVYHIFNRGVDGRRVFLDDIDRQHFYESMYLFNDGHFDEDGWGEINRGAEILTIKETGVDQRDCLVDVVTFNLMDNHFHLMLKQQQEGGISKFLHALQMGFARVFNDRYSRHGSLFERPFQSVHVSTETHMTFLPLYIHLNTLDRYGILWREGEMFDLDRIQFRLDQHSYSGHNIAMGRGQELPVIDVRYLFELYPTPETYLEHLHKWSSRHVAKLVELLDQFSDDVTRNPYKH